MQTQLWVLSVQHLTNPDDHILNAAQMCDAVHVQKFQTPPTHLDEPHVIDSSMCCIINLRKKKKEDAEKLSQGQGWGWGWGWGQGAESGGWGHGHGHVQSTASLPKELTLKFPTSNL